MVVTIHTDTFVDSQKLWDLCSISRLASFSFINDRPFFKNDDCYGIDMVIETPDDRYAFEKISRFVFEYFECGYLRNKNKEKKDD